MENLIKKRKAVGKTAAFLCVLFCLSIADAIVAGFRQPAGVFDLLPGSSAGISGFLPERVTSAREISYKAGSDSVKLSIDSIQKGHWFGNNMWQGRISAGADAPEGEYALTVGVEGGEKREQPAKYLIRVHSNNKSYRQSFKSLIKRHLDVSPWALALSFFIPVVPAFVCSFILSGKIEEIMAGEGKAVVYRVKKRGDEAELFFSLGSKHGIRENSGVTLLNEEGVAVGTATVHYVSDSESRAVLSSSCDVRPGYIVSSGKG
jgi:hypothetical protein